MAAVTICNDFGAQKNKVWHCFHCFPIYFPWSDRTGWDGWMASLTRWTWVWVNSGSWWWTGRPGVLQFMGSKRVGHDWATDLILCFDFKQENFIVVFIYIFPWLLMRLWSFHTFDHLHNLVCEVSFWEFCPLLEWIVYYSYSSL